MSYKKDKKFSAEDFASYESIDDLFVKNEGDNYYIRNINQNDADGYTPLCAAILNNADPLMLMYLTSVNSSNDDYLPKALRKTKNADVTKICDKGKAPIQIAIMAGNINAIKTLLGNYKVTVVAQEEKRLRSSYSYFKDVIKYKDNLPVYATDENGNPTDQYEYETIHVKIATSDSDLITISRGDILNASLMSKSDILDAIAVKYGFNATKWKALNSPEEGVPLENSPMLLAVKAQCYDSVKTIIHGLTGNEYNVNPLLNDKTSVTTAIKAGGVDVGVDGSLKPCQIIKNNKDVGLEKLLAPYCLIDETPSATVTTDESLIAAMFRWGDEDYIIDFLQKRFSGSNNIFSWSDSNSNLLYTPYQLGNEQTSLIEIINKNADILYEDIIKNSFASCGLPQFNMYFTKVDLATDPSRPNDVPLFNLIKYLYEYGTIDDLSTSYVSSICSISNPGYIKQLPEDFHREVGKLKRCSTESHSFKTDYFYLANFIESSYDETDGHNLWLKPTIIPSDEISESVYYSPDIENQYKEVKLYNVDDNDKSSTLTIKPTQFAIYNDSGVISSKFTTNRADKIQIFSDCKNALVVSFNDALGIGQFSLPSGMYNINGTTVEWNTSHVLYNLLYGASCEPNSSAPVEIGIIANVTAATLQEGETTTCNFKLKSQPLADVEITVNTDNIDRLTVSQDTLVFTQSDWNSTKSVTLYAIDNSSIDGTATVRVSASSFSSDARYNNLSIVPFNITVNDNDIAAIVYDSSSATLLEGASITRSFRLSSKPIGNVKISFSSDKPERLSLSKDSITFTPSNWDSSQPVNFTAIDDSLSNGNVNVTITLDVSSNEDTIYDSLPNSSLYITVNDNDIVGITCDTSPIILVEGGFNVVRTFALKSQPTSDVTLNYDYEYGDRFTVTPSYLVFNQSNWNIARDVTFSAIENSDFDGNITTPVNISLVSDDSDYNGITGVISVTVNDNDSVNATVHFANNSGVVVTDLPNDITKSVGSVITLPTVYGEYEDTNNFIWRPLKWSIGNFGASYTLSESITAYLEFDRFGKSAFTTDTFPVVTGSEIIAFIKAYTSSYYIEENFPIIYTDFTKP